MNTENLIHIRQKLHSLPELSGKEKRTARMIEHYLTRYNPDELKTGIGNYGIMAKFASEKPAKTTIAFRAELDAIAVHEKNECSYRSEKKGVMHGCGHDGHMAILLALAEKIRKNPLEYVDVWLIFQPAEETGEGARQMLEHPFFNTCKLKHIYALHNLPGFAENEMIVKEGAFAAASTGIDITFEGTFSHAAYPEQGENPAGAIAECIQFVETGFTSFKKKSTVNKVTITYLNLGERAFGINPGTGKMGVSLRAKTQEGLKQAIDQIGRNIKLLQEGFSGTISWRQTEPFSATTNHATGVEIARKAAKQAGFSVTELAEPFPWSEDFGEFGKLYPITLFGLGAGENHAPLHSAKYDFNENLLAPGAELFYNIASLYNTK